MDSKFIILCAGLCACGLGAVHADVLGSAKYIWDFDHDLNGDGLLQADEVRELRSFGATNAAYAGSVKASNIKGNDIQTQGPTFVTTDIWHAGRGIHYTGTALHFTVDNRATETYNAKVNLLETNCCPVGFTFENASITGSVTVLMRCRADSFNSWGGKTDHAWVVNNGEYWSTVAGSNFGFIPVGGQLSSGTTGAPSVYFGRSELHASGMINLQTNIWYDVGISLKDTGNGGAEALFVVHDAGRDSVYTGNADDVIGRVPWNFKTYKTSKTAGSGCFTNEVNHVTSIKIGAETPGSRVFRGANKGFAGDLQRVVMWDRALTEDELKEVIAGENQLFRIGVEDGTSGEFGDRANLADVPYNVTIPERDFHLMPSSVDAAHPTLSLTFTPKDQNYKNGHLLRVKVASGTTGVGYLRPEINGTPLGSKDVVRTGEAVWYVKSSLLKAGTNTLALTRLASSTTATIPFDLVEMTGSWYMGVEDWKNVEFSNESGVNLPCTVYAGYWDWGNVQRGVPTSWPSLDLKFFVPAYQAKRYDFVFRGNISSTGGNYPDYYVSDGYIEKAGYYPFSIYLNGQNVYTNTGIKSGSYAVSIPAGALSNGWNTIRLHNDAPSYSRIDDASGKSVWVACWILFDYHSLEIQPQPNGTFIILR